MRQIARRSNPSQSLLIAPLLCVFLSAQDWQDSNLPTSITLHGNRIDTITPSSNNTTTENGREVTTIGYQRNPSLAINGSGSYTLQVKYPVPFKEGSATYYSGGFTIGGGIQFALMNAHTLTIERSRVNVEKKGTFAVILSGEKINPQGTDYGKSSKVRFANDTQLNLASGATASFSNGSFFIHNGLIQLENQSELNIEIGTIRIQRKLQNNGGNIKFQGDVYNIGSNIGIATSQSHIIGNNGNIRITGNLHNGGQAKTDGNTIVDIFLDPPFGGGGNLLLKGGSMKVDGNIVSQEGGDSVAGEIANAQKSSISIYGGTLNAKELQNKKGSTLIFGFHSGNIGSFIGDLKNQEGIVQVDLKDAKQSGEYQLVKGGITGVTNQNISFINTNSNFTATEILYDPQGIWNGKISLVYEAPPEPPKPPIPPTPSDPLADFTQTLTFNQNAIFQALGGKQILELGVFDAPKLRTDLNALNQKMHSHLMSVPFLLTSMLKDQMHTPTNQSDLTLGIFAEGVGGGVSGSFGGLRLAYQHNQETEYGLLSPILQVAYGYADSIQSYVDGGMLEASFQDSSHHFALDGGLLYTPIANVDLQMHLGYATSLTNYAQSIKIRTLDSDEASLKHSLHQIYLDLQAGYRFDLPLSFALKPYLGINQEIYMIPRAKSQDFEIASQQIYQMDFALGVEGSYKYGEMLDISFGIKYQVPTIQSQDIAMSFRNHTLKFDSFYQQALQINLASQYYLTSEVNVAIEAFFKSTFAIENLYSGGIGTSVSYRF
ncbi:hypothetical protein BBW65_01250 [Helicobacter enhydrae]|uniref:Autotransporter domain-containing protein n=1 Tax=Helicobacter enhydrae TaxID=222136 RepID=A0A1B1U412_9HELI|nr:hypothetical protein [Helicobacter enhydrae]ANV97517.1 hypothetical protein BBW65_01250 [Helicobacter enhydrae]